MNETSENRGTQHEEPTGYRESPDTADLPAEQVEEAGGGEGLESEAVLTTDDEAQRDDTPLRPGNTSS